MSSVTYILVALTILSAIFSATFFAAWRSLGRPPHALSWSLAFVAATLQWATNLVNPTYPVLGQDWVAVNPLALVVITLALRGHRQRTECEWVPKNLWPYAVAVFMSIVYASKIQGHLGIASAILPFVAGVTLLMSAIMILDKPKTRESLEWIAALTISVFGAVQFIIAAVAYMQGPHGDPFYQDLWIMLTFVSVPATYVGIAITVFLMIAADLFTELREQAIRDKLTGLLNRRGLSEHATQVFAMTRRGDVPVSVIAADIDHFKEVNDRFGHAVGDQALQHIAAILLDGRRADDLVVRMGGEEFILVLPGTSLEQGLKIADRLRSSLQSTPMRHGAVAVQMTASFGVAAIAERDTTLSDAIERADEALYRSKRDGRNRVDLESSQRLKSIDSILPATE